MAERADLTEQALLWREPDRRGGGPVDHPAGEVNFGSPPGLAVRAAALGGVHHASHMCAHMSCGSFTSGG